MPPTAWCARSLLQAALDIMVAIHGRSEDTSYAEMTLARSRALGKIVCMRSVHEVIPWRGYLNSASSEGSVMMLVKTIAPGRNETPIDRKRLLEFSPTVASANPMPVDPRGPSGVRPQ